MHISDGVLPTYATVGGYVVSAALTGWSARKTRGQDLPKLAVVTAAFFVASLIHVPLGPTSAHLLIPGLTGALLGPPAFLSIGLGLLLQSFLFQFGGLTALGANTLMMGLPAVICGWIFQRYKGRTQKRQAIVGGLVGALGTAMAAIFLALLLVTGGGPTEDKPDVTFAAPPHPATVSHAMTLRVPDCRAAYRTLKDRGAEFLTPPVDRGAEVRCFFRDPDGHLLEISEVRTA